MSAAQEKRYRKRVIEQGREADDRRRLMEAAAMPRTQRDPAPAPPPAARRRDVRLWMRHNANHYESATHLAEAANAIFNLPGDGLDDEAHWVWDEAAEAITEIE